MRFVEAMDALGKVGLSSDDGIVARLSEALSEAVRAIREYRQEQRVVQTAPDDDDFTRYCRDVLRTVLDCGDETIPAVARQLATIPGLHAVSRRWRHVVDAALGPGSGDRGPAPPETACSSASSRPNAAEASAGEPRPSDHTSSIGDEELSLTKAQWNVLLALYKRKGKLLLIDDIVREADVGEGTAKTAVLRLKALGLAARPLGDRSGATITLRGKALIAGRNTP
jgi:hypothetical protein